MNPNYCFPAQISRRKNADHLQATVLEKKNWVVCTWSIGVVVKPDKLSLSETREETKLRLSLAVS